MPAAARETQWLNPAAWTINNYQIGTNGNAGRGICDGPGFFQVDAALYKNIRLGKRVKLQLRAEVFNVFNRTNFLVGDDVDDDLEPGERGLRHGQRGDRDADHQRDAGRRTSGSSIDCRRHPPGAARDPAELLDDLRRVEWAVSSSGSQPFFSPHYNPG